MTPLEMGIICGREDDRLLHHIHTMEQMRAESARGLSRVEECTLERCYERLDQLTDPEKPAPSGPVNALATLMADGLSPL